MPKYIDKKDLLKMYFGMFAIRAFEEKVGREYPNGQMRTPTHLGIGQEAVAVGVLHSRDKEDVIFSHHRCHNHYLAAGGSREKLFAELLGKASGCSGGRGGSVHLVSREQGFFRILSNTWAISGFSYWGRFCQEKIEKTGNFHSFFWRCRF